MYALKELIAGYAQSGSVTWIGLRPTRRADMIFVGDAFIDESGLTGDHGRAGKRAVTLIQAEHLPVISAMLGKDEILPAVLRRNLLVSGINLSALKGRQIAIGGAVLQITSICAPCSRMEEVLGRGGYSAVRGHGGWCASVLGSGCVRLGDAVRPID